jgi:hypothetical protein
MILIEQACVVNTAKYLRGCHTTVNALIPLPLHAARLMSKQLRTKPENLESISTRVLYIRWHNT